MVHWMEEERLRTGGNCCLYTRHALYLVLDVLLLGIVIACVAGFTQDVIQYTPHLPPGYEKIGTGGSDASAAADLATFIAELRPRPPHGVNTKDTDQAPGCANIAQFDSWRCNQKKDDDGKRSGGSQPVSDWNPGSGCESYPNFVLTAVSFHIIGMAPLIFPLYTIGTMSTHFRKEHAVRYGPHERISALMWGIIGWGPATLLQWLAVAFLVPVCTSALCSGPDAKPLNESGTCKLLPGVTCIIVAACVATSAFILNAILLYLDIRVLGRAREEKKKKPKIEMQGHSGGGFVPEEQHIERLVRFYGTHAPHKATEEHVYSVLEQYNGQEEKLFRGLVQKYGPEPEDDPSFPSGNTNGDERREMKTEI